MSDFGPIESAVSCNNCYKKLAQCEGFVFRRVYDNASISGRRLYNLCRYCYRYFSRMSIRYPEEMSTAKSAYDFYTLGQQDIP